VKSAPGVLLLHGFTSSVQSVNGLVPRLQARDIPCHLPVLRGHGSRPEELQGVIWRDWLEDARRGLFELCGREGRCLVVGLSMGGLLALHLAAEHAPRVAGVVSLAPCLEFRSPLVRLLGLIQRVRPWWPSSPEYADPELAAFDDNYPRFPVSAFAQLFAYREVVRDLLPLVRAPLLILAARRDPVVRPDSADLILKGVASAYKEVRWFDLTKHEMLRDVEREAVAEAVLGFWGRLSAGEFEASPAGVGS
jgi:carboxylesterase